MLRDVEMGNYMNGLGGSILASPCPFGDKYWKYDTAHYGEIIAYTWLPCGTSSTPHVERLLAHAEGATSSFGQHVLHPCGCRAVPLIKRASPSSTSQDVSTARHPPAAAQLLPAALPTIMNSAAWSSTPT